MRYLQRYLSLLFALVMCVGVFSVTAHAESASISELTIDWFGSLKYPNGTVDNSSIYSVLISHDDGVDVKKAKQFTLGSVSGEFVQTYHAKISSSDGVPFLKANSNLCTFSLNNLYYSVLVTNSPVNTYFRNPRSVRALVYYDTGAKEYFDVTEYHVVGDQFNCSFEFAPISAVQSVEFIIEQSFTYDFNSTSTKAVQFYFWESTTSVFVDEPTKTEGFLSGIFDKVKDGFQNVKEGFQNVKEGFQNVKEGFTNVVDNITSLPQKLWDKISDGLKSLFVPSDDEMVSYKDKWDVLLSDRLGAVYQVVNIMTDSWDNIMQADQTDTIEFPSATINFSGTDFTFGGYNVKIVPDGFDVLVTAIKSIVAIVCTVAFVNGLRRRYDEIMGVEQ